MGHRLTVPLWAPILSLFFFLSLTVCSFPFKGTPFISPDSESFSISIIVSSAWVFTRFSPISDTLRSYLGLGYTWAETVDRRHLVKFRSLTFSAVSAATSWFPSSQQDSWYLLDTSVNIIFLVILQKAGRSSIPPSTPASYLSSETTEHMATSKIPNWSKLKSWNVMTLRVRLDLLFFFFFYLRSFLLEQ